MTTKETMHIDPYERAWMMVSLVLLVVFTIAIAVAGFALGIQVPSPEQRVDPRTVATNLNSPWVEPGLRELAPGKYEAYILAQTWQFLPREITVSAGYPLRGAANPLEAAPNVLSPTRIVLEVDGQTLWDRVYLPNQRSGRAVIFEQIGLEAGERYVRLLVFDRPNPLEGQVLFDAPVSLESRGLLRLSFPDAPLRSDPEEGRKLFFESSLGASASCHVCHSIVAGDVKVGPSLAGVASRAATRVAGQSAEEYLRQSLLEPDAYGVEGFPAGLMLPDLGEKLSNDQIDNLIAFLLTLK